MTHYIIPKAWISLSRGLVNAIQTSDNLFKSINQISNVPNIYFFYNTNFLNNWNGKKISVLKLFKNKKCNDLFISLIQGNRLKKK